MSIGGTCAACGLPGHRYGTTHEGRYDPVGCINSLRGELDKAHRHLAEGATMMEALLADREQLAGVVESIAARDCLCTHPATSKPHGGPCCGVAGGKCVTCEARAGLEQA